MTRLAINPFTQALRSAAARVIDGTHQDDREPVALRPGQFEVDGLGFEQRVAIAARFAAHLRLHGAGGRPGADWAGLFDADEVLLLARIAAEAQVAAQDLVRRDLEAIALPALEARCDQLAARVSQWRHALERAPGDGALTLLRAIDDMRERARAAGFLPAPGAPDGDPLPDDPSARREALRNRLDRLNGVLLRLQDLAARALPDSLQSGQHEAAASLVITFLQLMGTVQQHINRFTERHTDFYFDEVLHMRPRPARPDHAHLVLKRDPRSAIELVVPAGTRFLAGRDEAGADIVFTADTALAVSEARVARLCTLRLERDPLISPEHELGYVNRARSMVLPVADDAAPRSMAQASEASWPLLGGSEQPGGLGVADDACLGLAIASPQLLLQEGERRVQITLRLSQNALVDARIQGLVARQLAPDAPPDTLQRVLQAFIDQDRQRPPAGACTAQALAASCQALFAALPPSRRNLRGYYRCFLLQRALHSTGQGFRHAAGQLFAHWLLSHRKRLDDPGQPGESAEPDDWLSPADHRALKLAAAKALAPVAETWDGGVLRSPRAGLIEADDGQEDEAGPGIGDPLSFLLGPPDLVPDRDLVFARLFTGLFAVRYSGPNGWNEVANAHVVRPDDGNAPGSARLQLRFRLGRAEPPVVACTEAAHGSAWAGAPPVVQLRLKAFGGLYPHSMLESALLLDIQLAVQVRGLRQLSLQNQLGRLDPSKPFHPFGPLPTRGAYLVVGSPEVARKALTGLSLQLQWGGLPADAAGMVAQYEGYPAEIDNRSFGVSLSVLRDAQWQPQTDTPHIVPLFQADAAVGPLEPTSELPFDSSLLRHQVQPVDGEALAAHYDLSARHGFVRVQLLRPDSAFGHADYPHLLTQVVTTNARHRRQLPLPRPPYTPLLEGLSLDYSAERLIALGTPSVASGAAAGAVHDMQTTQAADRVYHLHPFGVKQVHPLPEAMACHLLPRHRHDGHLFIGVQSPRRPGRLSLLFDLNEEAAVVRQGPMPPLSWSVLVGDTWCALPPRHLLSDSTHGMLGSGIVELDLPEAIDEAHCVMPDGLYWLALAADEGFERFAGLRSVRANALRVTRQLPPPAPGAEPVVLEALPPGRIQMPSLPGLAAVAQPAPSFGARAAEDRAQMRVRTGERLRHKQRASLPWDIERLVLEQCPQVCKLKCFAAGELPDSPPGRVVVAVVASPERFNREAGRLYPRLTAIELTEIAELLRGLASPFASLVVRNAAQERVQVHCSVTLRPGVPVGATLQAIDRSIFDFLSPWCPGGLQPRFGWVVRAEDIEAHLRAQVPGVEFITGVSMLHLAESDAGYHALGDTANPPGLGLGRNAPVLQIAEGADDPLTPRIPARPLASTRPQRQARVEVRPMVPWSIAVPMLRHTIRLAPARAPQPAQNSGIADLSVGSNLIIGGIEHG